ncbi:MULTISPECIES: GNAT family N-acetyltransferase [Planococcus]|uniref:Lipid II:glycine glycyltransferase n=2 Tax=Planococcus TaxID=1372 RepID=A0ABM5WUB4_9BACL|nr:MULTISPECIES: GNAT family N-acetyltransferase [Planococcus]ALS77926.1 acetyltransferase [Planococcus kocurii]AQU80171.1 GNAT family N-acetyltransferase [Planococcus faecalis]MDJ0332617.1 GNAT family N-acetyltransferase [Planococcus sp. S3-L1]
MRDLFLTKDYIELYEKMEGGICEVFEFEHPLGSVYHQFIKREIPVSLEGGPYFDLLTPYGYGGPIITELADKTRKDELITQFSQAFQDYCQRHNIVSEFVRFHPIAGNAEDFKSCYTVLFRRHTTGVTLKGFEDPVQEEFSGSTRKRIRKALRDGVTYRITLNPSNLDQFQDIYLATMKRVGAADFYLFDREYFSKILDNFGDQLLLVEAIFDSQVIGAELHFHSGNVIHTHLSGTVDGDFNHLSPVYVMTYAIVLWAKEQGVEYIHSGGGVNPGPDDTLYLFKKKFGKNTEFDYYVGNKIWDQQVYQQLLKETDANIESELFPAYRWP